jgi:hypothetical protein
VKYAQAITQILAQGINKGEAALVAAELFRLFQATEFDGGVAASFGGRHAGAKVVFNEELEMVFEFFGEFVILFSAGNRKRKRR